MGLDPENTFASLPLSELSKTIHILSETGQDPELLKIVRKIYSDRGGKSELTR